MPQLMLARWEQCSMEEIRMLCCCYRQALPFFRMETQQPPHRNITPFSTTRLLSQALTATTIPLQIAPQVVPYSLLLSKSWLIMCPLQSFRSSRLPLSTISSPPLLSASKVLSLVIVYHSVKLIYSCLVAQHKPPSLIKHRKF